MAYAGYLIKIGSGNNAYIIPLKYMRYESYQITYYTQDLDSYRDADGILHRNALQHKVGKIEFNTPLMNNTEMETLLSNIRSRYIDANEKKILVTFFVPESNLYIAQDMYVPDIVTKIRNVDEAHGIINYQETRIAFIGY